jgi:hypothetical protein
MPKIGSRKIDHSVAREYKVHFEIKKDASFVFEKNKYLVPNKNFSTKPNRSIRGFVEIVSAMKKKCMTTS